jgi:hypothetical protein
MMINVKSINSDLPPIVLRALAGTYSLLNLSVSSAIPPWAQQVTDANEMISITRSAYGFSIICPDSWVPVTLDAEHVPGWRVLRVEEPRDWAMHGLYARLTEPLSDDAISIYIVGAYNSDHILVRDQDFPRATQILSRFCDMI